MRACVSGTAWAPGAVCVRGSSLQLPPSHPLPCLQPKEGEMTGMSGHVIIGGFGRVGQLIAQMLSERLIPFVALDVSASRVQVGAVCGLAWCGASWFWAS